MGQIFAMFRESKDGSHGLCVCVRVHAHHNTFQVKKDMFADRLKFVFFASLKAQHMCNSVYVSVCQWKCFF